MPVPHPTYLRHGLLKAQQEIERIELVSGQDSLEYRAALKHFVRLWAVLKMSRSREEFLKEIT